VPSGDRSGAQDRRFAWPLRAASPFDRQARRAMYKLEEQAGFVADDPHGLNL
jgi:hypothetical protein